MPDAAADVAAMMATSWNEAHRLSPAAPLDMWPCCQILAESGYVVGQQEDLSAVTLGPFKVAVARNENAVKDFLEALFPAVAASLPSSTPLASAVSGGLTAACLLFVKLLDRGVVFTSRPVDKLRWAVLMDIAARNADSAYPAVAEIAGGAAVAAAGEASAADTRAAVEWLLQRGLIAHSPRVPGGLEACV